MKFGKKTSGIIIRKMGSYSTNDNGKKLDNEEIEGIYLGTTRRRTDSGRENGRKCRYRKTRNRGGNQYGKIGRGNMKDKDKKHQAIMG